MSRDGLTMVFWGVMLPVVGSIVASVFFPDWQLVHIGGHAAMEALGALAAMVILLFVRVGRRALDLTEHEVLCLSAALASMGLLDAAHAVMPPGNNFVWFHSAATLAGGGWLACLWFSPQRTARWTRALCATMFATVAFTAISLIRPDIVPRMVQFDNFSIVAQVMNLGGGWGFIAATIYFYRRFSKAKQHGYYLLAAHCLLFGSAGMLFELSSLWDMAWWWWHVLRMAAYTVLVGYALVEFSNAKNWRKAHELNFLTFGSQFAGAASLACVAMAAVVMFGWHTENTLLIQIHSTFAPMQYNTALGFLLLGGGAFSLLYNRYSVGQGLGILLVLLSVVTGSQYVLEANFGIDELFMEGYVDVKTSHVGRMAPNTAICFFLAGLGIYFHKHKYLLLSLAATVLFLAFLSLLGYAVGEEGGYGWGALTRMALHTSIGFVLGGLALLFKSFIRRGEVQQIDFWGASSLLLAVLMSSVTFLGWYFVEQNVKDENQKYFNALVTDAEDILDDRFLLYTQSLWGALGLFNASEYVSPDEWEAYTDSLHISERLPGINGVGYIDYLREEEVSSYIKKTRKELNYPEFTVHPKTLFEDKFVIRYILPRTPNIEAVGLDIGFEQNRRQAAELARDQAIATLTKKIELVQDRQSMAGFLILLPVYSTIAPPETLEARRKAIEGWVYAPFVGKNFLGGIADHEESPLTFAVYDGVQERDSALIYGNPIAPLLGGEEMGLVKRSIERFANRDWTIVWRASAAFQPPASEILPTVVLVGGMLLTSAFSLLFWLLSRLYGHAAKEAADYLGKLEETNIQLEQKIDLVQNYAQQLEQARSQIEKAHQMKSDFLSSVSHEIRSPLSSIMAGLDILNAMETDEDMDEVLDLMGCSTENLLLLVNDILDLSKLESGNLQLHEDEFEIRELCDSVFKMMKSLAAARDNSISFKVSDDVDAQLIGDDLRLRQVLINLLSNAVKFTEHGQIEFGVSKEAGSKHTQTVKFSVKDSGPGIPREKQKDIFERFRQADSGTTRSHGGTGLGLAICAELVELMHGRIGVESKPGDGSLFWFTVRFKKDAFESAEEAEKRKKEAKKKADDSFEGFKILLVEDDPANRNVMRKVIEALGQEVGVASDGAEALEKATTGEYDLIFMDCQMPVMDGMESAEKIRAEGISCPIIALTGHDLEEDREKCLRAGMNDFITKPIRSADLSRLLRKWLS